MNDTDVEQSPSKRTRRNAAKSVNNRKPTDSGSGPGNVESKPIMIEDGDDNNTVQDPTDLKDADYDPNQERSKLTSKSRKRKLEPKDWDHKKLLSTYLFLRGEKDKTDTTLKITREIRKDAGEKLDKKREECKELKSKNDSLTTKVHDLREQLRDQYEKHHAETEQLREDFRKAEQDLVAKLDSQKSYQFLPDNKIQNAFHDLWNKCRDWVRKWMEDLPIQCDSPYLDDYCCRDDHRLAVYLAEEFEANQKLFMRTMGLAMLSRQVQGMFLSKPFAFLADEDRKSFENSHSNFEKMNQREAYAWRATTIRCFRTDFNIEALEISAEKVKSRSLNQLCFTKAQKIIEIIETQIAHPLPTLERDKMLLELKIICLNASLLAFELHCQKSKTEVLGSDQLFEVPFTISSELHHPVASMGLDDDDTSLDGINPHTIVVPAICMWGNVDGEHLETRKILSKTHVFISKNVLKRLKEPNASQSTPPSLLQNRTRSSEHEAHHQETKPDSNLPTHRCEGVKTDGSKRRRIEDDTSSKGKQHKPNPQISVMCRSSTPENDPSPPGKSQSKTFLSTTVDGIAKGNTYDLREEERERRRKDATSELTAIDQKTLEEEQRKLSNACGFNSESIHSQKVSKLRKTEEEAQSNVGAPGVKEEKTSPRSRERAAGEEERGTRKQMNQE